MLINDILNMREIERGDVELKEEVVDINLAISKIINIIKIDANKKDINLTINIKKSPIEFVYMDELRASQIVLNICNNAVQFTPRKGKIEISFIATGVKDNKTYYTIIVEDNGIGMSKDFLDKLFKPFSKETNQEIIGTGTGIGLSIVKRLVDLMEGTINVESEKGKGSKFTVKLAFEICNDKKPMPAIKNNYQLKGQRILICEDNDINALILKKLLESKGMIVDSASNGLMGLQKAKKNNYAAILMDIRMPIMDGLEAAKKIRKFDNKIPIIALSANAFDEDIRKSYKAGMNAHLSKPINKTELFATLNQFIK